MNKREEDKNMTEKKTREGSLERKEPSYMDSVYKAEGCLGEAAPKYLTDAEMLKNISLEVSHYSEAHSLLRWPNPINVFFRPGDDHEIEHINSVLEVVIEDLSYTKDNYVLMKINQYPIIATHAHTRPFQRKWLNMMTGLFLPTGIFFYFRMLRFRFRLYKDLQHIQRINKKLIPRVIEMGDVQKEMNPII